MNKINTYRVVNQKKENPQYRVHSMTCKDFEKEMFTYSCINVFKIKGETAKIAVINEVNEANKGQDSCFYVEDYRICNCCKK